MGPVRLVLKPADKSAETVFVMREKYCRLTDKPADKFKQTVAGIVKYVIATTT